MVVAHPSKQIAFHDQRILLLPSQRFTWHILFNHLFFLQVVNSLLLLTGIAATVIALEEQTDSFRTLHTEECPICAAKRFWAGGCGRVLT